MQRARASRRSHPRSRRARRCSIVERAVGWAMCALYNAARGAAPPASRSRRPPPLPAAAPRLVRRHQRDLPWRRTRDPYHILVSEIMLQQTQVERVMPKYHEFLGRYPTLEAWPQARARRGAEHLVSARLQRAAAEPAGHRARDGRPLWRAPPRRRRRTEADARHRALHRGRHPLLRLSAATPRSSTPTSAASSAASSWAPAGSGGCAATGPSGRSPRRSLPARAAPTTTTRRSWTSARPGARPARPAARAAR